jgi:RNA polymerase sigma-70 factor (ECF subfamily)
MTLRSGPAAETGGVPDTATRLFLRFRDRRDGRALARLFDRAAPELLAVAVHLAPDVASAEDLVQATFVAAIEGAERFDAAREVKPWLFGILAREAAKARRRAARVVDPGSALREDVEPSPLDTSATREVHELVDQALGRLPEHDRAVLVPYLTEGLSAVEIARRAGGVAGPSAAHVRVRIGRGLARLRAILPRGLALGAVGLAAPRGHAAVRSAVLQRAGVDAPLGVAGLVAISSLGAVALSKSLAFVSVAAVALFVWTTSGGEDVPYSPTIATDTTLQVARLEVPTEANEGAAPIGARTRVVAAVESAAQSGFASPSVAAPDASVRGRVVDAEGRPVPGARLVLSDTEGVAWEGIVIGDPTDANGDFDLGREFQTGQVRARHPEYVTSTKVVIVPGEHLELRMRGPAARLVVHVTDKEGDPVTGATVRVGVGSLPYEVWVTDQDGATDDAGLAELAGLEPGWSPVTVRALGFVQMDTRVALQAGVAKTLELSLERGRRVIGRVSFTGGARPKGVQAVVRLRIDSPRINLWVQADADGAFELSGIPWSGIRSTPPTYVHTLQVIASATGFESAILDLPEGGSRETVWNPTLVPSRAIAGRVVDARGVGLADWHVRLHSAGGQDDPSDSVSPFIHWIGGDVHTAPDGSFSLPGPSDSPVHVSAWVPDGPIWAGPTIVARDVTEGTHDLELRVGDDVRATGIVRGRFECETNGRTLEVKLTVRKAGSSFGGYVDVAADGRFELEHVPPGRYSLDFVVGGIALVAREEAVVGPDVVIDLGDVRVADAGLAKIAIVGPDTPLRGTFGWSFKSPATGPGSYGGSGAPPDSLTLPGGVYELELNASHYFSAPVRFHVVPNGETTVEVTVEPATLATFRFVPADGGTLVYPLQVVVIDQASGHELGRSEVASGEPVALDIDPVVCRIEATDAAGRRGGLTGYLTGKSQRRGLVRDIMLKK